MAIKDAGLTPPDIGHINAHGLSSIESDHHEAQAIHDVFGEIASKVPVTALQSYFEQLPPVAARWSWPALWQADARNRADAQLPQSDAECGLNVVHGEPLAVKSRTFLKINVTRMGQASFARRRERRVAASVMKSFSLREAGARGSIAIQRFKTPKSVCPGVMFQRYIEPMHTDPNHATWPRSAHAYPARWITPAEFREWIGVYNRTGIADESRPRDELIARLGNVQFIVCSDYPRSIESAARLFQPSFGRLFATLSRSGTSVAEPKGTASTASLESVLGPALETERRHD